MTAGLRTIVFIAMGLGLSSLSKSLELRGDVAPSPSDRLFFHVLALVVLVAALACFLWVLWQGWRTIAGRGKQEAAKVAEVFADEQPDEFDPDAVLQRYLAGKPEDANAPAVAAAASMPASAPVRGTFGRKGL